MSTRVTTIIPAFNAASTLADAVRSLAGQGIGDHEIIIIDDGSTDSTRAVAEEIALGHDGVWIISQTNAGVSAARNTGLGVARGEWVHFLDADDWMLPGGLARLVEASERGGKAGACGESRLFDERGISLGWSIGPGVGPSVPHLGIEHLLEHNRFQPGAMVLRRSVLGDTRFDPRIARAEDWDLWLRLAERGARWSVVRDDVAAYRLRRSGASHGFGAMASSMRAVLESAFERCRTHCTAIVPASGLRSERLTASLRRSALHQATAASLLDGTPDADGAFTVLVSNWPAPGIGATPRELADAAFWMVPFADGRAPNMWYDADGALLSRSTAALDALWSRCVRERFIREETAGEARERLAALCVPPQQVAERLVQGFGPNRRITLLGLGRNAQHVGAALAARGFRFDARCDGVSADPSRLVVGGVEVEVAGPSAPYDGSALYLVTPSDDEALITGLPRGLDCVRWSKVSQELCREALVRLNSNWNAGNQRIGAAA